MPAAFSLSITLNPYQVEVLVALVKLGYLEVVHVPYSERYYRITNAGRSAL